MTLHTWFRISLQTSLTKMKWMALSLFVIRGKSVDVQSFNFMTSLYILLYVRSVTGQLTLHLLLYMAIELSIKALNFLAFYVCY